ncbi:MAG: NAD-dependent deacylase [Bacteroidales bacterium]|nr:NAD-dependent deacylase [Bacteroidales bacterium]
MDYSLQQKIQEAVPLLQKSAFTTAFTGAGISVESGIPPFRGEEGLWNKYDPKYLEIGFFLSQPEEAWRVIKQIFFDFFGTASPNQAHLTLAGMERRGMLHRIITQNIDNLHQEAGSTNVFEFHGNSKKLVCLACYEEFPYGMISLDTLPPRCPHCQGLLKPDFVFFGEAIPQEPMMKAYDAAGRSDVFLIIGSTGEVMPANQIPPLARQHGAKIIEINPEESNYTQHVTDIYLKGKAGEVMKKLGEALFAPSLEDN